MKTSFYPIFLAGLFSASIARADGGNVVPIPDDLKQPPAGIMVTGEPGTGQPDSFLYHSIATDSKGRIEYGFWPTDEAGTQTPLNQEAQLPPGLYFVGYAENFTEVNLQKGEHKVIQLGKLTVPKVDGSYGIRVMPDLTNPDEQKQQLLNIWSAQQGTSATDYVTYWHWHHSHTDSYDEWITAEELCQAGDQKRIIRGYCAAVKAMDYTKLKGSAVLFHADGSYSGMNIAWNDDGDGTLSEGDESYIQSDPKPSGEGRDGDTFSLFPGTYRVQMTNSAGKTVNKLGQVVK